MSFHHGDNRKYRGIPSSFWEVYNNEDQTGFTLQILDDELDNGFVVCGEIFQHKVFFIFLIRKKYFMKEVIFILKTLYKFYNYKIIKRIKKKTFQISTSSLNFINQLFILKIIYRKIFNLIYKNLIVHNWSVLYSSLNYKNLNDYNFLYIKNPKGTFFADPFLLNKIIKKICFSRRIRS